jgi:hypothetical protein
MICMKCIIQLYITNKSEKFKSWKDTHLQEDWLVLKGSIFCLKMEPF